MTDEEYRAWKAQIDLADPEELRVLAHKFLKLAEDSMDPCMRSLNMYASSRFGRESANTNGWLSGRHR